MKKIVEVLRLHFKLELSLRQSARAANVSRGTASNYCKRFEQLDKSIDDFISLNEIQQEKLFYPNKLRKSSSTKVKPDCLYLHNELKRKKKTKVTLALLHEEYKEQNPDNYYSYTQFRDYYSKFANKLNPSMKQIHIAGEKVFVDYSGLVVPIYNSKTGAITTSQIFVAVLGASGYTFIHATYSQKQRDFILSHTLAYEFFGGVPKIVVPDNLKSAVIANNKNGIIINDSYLALSQHYNMYIEPARPLKPKDKPKAEQGVQGIQRWILARLRHRKFFSVDELNNAFSELLDIYNNKIVKRFNKSRTTMFEELDKPNLLPLPQQRYVYRDFKICTVTQSYHIFLEGCEYSVPFKYLQYKVEARYSTQTVEIYFKNNLIATHPKLHFAGAVSTLTEHMPKDHEYQKCKTNPGTFLNRATRIGIHAVVWVKHEFDTIEHKPNAYRKINAILSLAKTYSNEELDLAIEYAYAHNVVNHTSVKSILQKKLYLQKDISTTPVNVINLNEKDIFRGNIYQ
jgi:transposase